MRLELPEEVVSVIRQLYEAGFEAYAVGGCVRDLLLGKQPKDWDITTSASPLEVKAIFPRTVDTGIQHGTVTVMIGKTGYEVTTYRLDGIYEDGRHPKQVVFSPSLKEDLKRRDFTINAMAYHPTKGLVDLFDGIGDLNARVIRCVGEAKDRFEEDALRILRAFRFSAQLDFTVQEDTLSAAKEKAERLQRISMERIREELQKLLLSDHPDRFFAASKAGILTFVLPELDYAIKQGSIRPDAMKNAALLPEDPPALRWAMLLYFLGEDANQAAMHTKKTMRRLKFDNATMSATTALLSCLDLEPEELSLAGVRNFVSRIGKELIENFFPVRRALILAEGENKEARLEALKQMMDFYDEICLRGDCIAIKDLAVNGEDLISAGFVPGKELGSELKRLLALVLLHPEWNKKETLLNLYGK